MRTNLYVFVILFALCTSVFTKPVHAVSEADCAIWLCLPGGFPTGCSAAYSAFKHRIKHDKPPLPELSSCTTGPDGKGSSGHYQMGYEYFEPCKEGYRLEQSQKNGFFVTGHCEKIKCERYWNQSCDRYEAVRRAKPSYIKMWVDGNYLGQFFY